MSVEITKSNADLESELMAKNESEESKPAWGAVFAVSLAAAGLTASQSLPVSLLTPLAADLRITEGMAGQTMTATTVVGFVTSLLIVVAARNFNRRALLLLFSVVLVTSNLLVAIAPNLPILFLGRMLLGVAVGGFWTFSASLAMRLVPATFVPRAFSIIFGGTSIAAVVAAPTASYLGDIIGWRGIFLGAAVLALVALGWQFVALPSMPARGRRRLATLFHLLRRPPVRLGMVGVILSFAGHIAFFTYLRPFLEIVTGVGIGELAAILLAFGLASFVGTSFAGTLLQCNLRLTLALATFCMSVLAVGFLLFGESLLITSILLVLWGLANGTIPVGWSTWLTRAVPDEAESGGGLLVAAIQLALTIGAAAGGIAFDVSGAVGMIVLSGITLLLCSLVTVFGVQSAVGDYP